MRDPKRIPEVLKWIKKIWVKHPDLRLGQLLQATTLIRHSDLYYVEDNELVGDLIRLDNLLQQLSKDTK